MAIPSAKAPPAFCPPRPATTPEEDEARLDREEVKIKQEMKQRLAEIWRKKAALRLGTVQGSADLEASAAAFAAASSAPAGKPSRDPPWPPVPSVPPERAVTAAATTAAIIELQAPAATNAPAVQASTRTTVPEAVPAVMSVVQTASTIAAAARAADGEELRPQLAEIERMEAAFACKDPPREVVMPPHALPSVAFTVASSSVSAGAALAEPPPSPPPPPPPPVPPLPETHTPAAKAAQPLLRTQVEARRAILAETLSSTAAGASPDGWDEVMVSERALAEEQGFFESAYEKWFCPYCEKDKIWNVSEHVQSHAHINKKRVYLTLRNNMEAYQCGFYPDFVEMRPDGNLYCTLCWLYYTDAHAASDKHKRKVQWRVKEQQRPALPSEQPSLWNTSSLAQVSACNSVPTGLSSVWVTVPTAQATVSAATPVAAPGTSWGSAQPVPPQDVPADIIDQVYRWVPYSADGYSGGYYDCLLCGNVADEGHLWASRHKKRTAWPYHYLGIAQPVCPVIPGSSFIHGALLEPEVAELMGAATSTASAATTPAGTTVAMLTASPAGTTPAASSNTWLEPWAATATAPPATPSITSATPANPAAPAMNWVKCIPLTGTPYWYDETAGTTVAPQWTRPDGWDEVNIYNVRDYQ